VEFIRHAHEQRVLLLHLERLVELLALAIGVLRSDSPVITIVGVVTFPT